MISAVVPVYNEEESLDAFYKVLIPNLVTQINSLLHQITDCTDYSIEAKINIDRFNKVGINWLMNSPSGLATLNKAGGFRQYITGLILRITLGQMDATHMNNTQLFIDEGFTFCDVDNLEKIPIFLRNLTELYTNGLLIVSHLGLIKETADVAVNIEKNPDFTSRIRFLSSHKIVNEKPTQRIKLHMKNK